MVFKKVTLIGTSGESFEHAVDDAIQRAEMSLDHVQWVEITEQSVQVGGLNDREYQVEAEIAFELEA